MALGLTEEHLELAAAIPGWAQRHSPAAGGRPAAAGGPVSEGDWRAVVGGSRAALVTGGVRPDQGEVWAAIDAASLQITRLVSLDLTRPVARIRASGVALPADRLLAGLDRG